MDANRSESVVSDATRQSNSQLTVASEADSLAGVVDQPRLGTSGTGDSDPDLVAATIVGNPYSIGVRLGMLPQDDIDGDTAKFWLQPSFAPVHA